MPKPSKRRKQRTGKRKRQPGVDSKGYLVIKAGPQRDQRVHTLVAEAMLGRKLRKDEDVHHKDGNKLNCEWKNLQVLGHDSHGAVSAKQHYYLKTHDIKLKEEWDKFFDEADKQGGAEGDTTFP